MAFVLPEKIQTVLDSKGEVRIRNKVTIIILLSVNAILTTFLIFLSFQQQPAVSQPPLPPEPLTDISHDLLLSILLPHTEAAVLGHYKNMNGYGVAIDPAMMEVIELKRKGHVQAFTFEVQVRLIPLVAGYHQLGEDILTFEINDGRIKLIDFEHLQELPPPEYNLPNLQNQ
ncbi:MAG: DUF3888 domain-containing protein [Firmicutes bacterium]|nr:DUF3888 domain-containing protein [Bacillota bacterium]